MSVPDENKSGNPPTKPAPKIHYSWYILAVTFLTLLIAAGVRSAPGVLIVPLEEYFGWNRAEISLAIAVNLALYGLVGPFAAALVEMYGLRRVVTIALCFISAGTFLSSWMQQSWHMLLIWGVVVGIGTGFTSSVVGSIVAMRWFSKHKGLVVGIFSASAGSWRCTSWALPLQPLAAAPCTPCRAAI